MTIFIYSVGWNVKNSIKNVQDEVFYVDLILFSCLILVTSDH